LAAKAVESERGALDDEGDEVRGVGAWRGRAVRMARGLASSPIPWSWLHRISTLTESAEPASVAVRRETHPSLIPSSTDLPGDHAAPSVCPTRVKTQRSDGE
jgi:hypothetical protein